jgi:segregation and condensation protein B
MMPTPDAAEPPARGEGSEARGASAEELVGHIVALLFVTDGPLDAGSLARVLEVRPAAVEAALAVLAERPPPGLILQRHGGWLQLATEPRSAEFVRRLRGQAEVQRLSRAALEVLSIIAYRQPATRGEIESIRGVNSDHALDTLLARGLVAEIGRKETIGRPMLFGTTLEFLQLAGLRSLDELPVVEFNRATPGVGGESS